MNNDMLPYLFSFIWPASLLLLIFCFVPRRGGLATREPGRFAIMTVLAIAIVVIPVGGIPLGRWLTGLCANFSLPLLALIADAIARKTFKVELLGKNGMNAALAFGALAGAVLYPMALGLGAFDPYSLGWSFSALFVISGALTAVLLWLGNRFGLVLLCAVAAYHLGLLESDNYWDYLVDPVFFLISLLAVIRRLFRRASPQISGAAPETSGTAA